MGIRLFQKPGKAESIKVNGEKMTSSGQDSHPLLTGSPLCVIKLLAEEGAHKLTNTSDSKPLVYLDFATTADMDVAVYPDSNKVGIWAGTALREVFRLEDNVGYYDRELPE